MSLLFSWKSCSRGSSLRHAYTSTRYFSTGFSKIRGRPINSLRFSRVALVAGATAVGCSAVLAHLQSPVYADATLADEMELGVQRKDTPLSTLIRSYFVYTACSFPALVDMSPKILSVLMSIPGLKQITEVVVRYTFFDQFVGGDTAHGTLHVLEDLRTENKGCLFAYSVEVDEHEAAGKGKQQKEPVYKRIVQEMIRSIDVAADFEDYSHLTANTRHKGRRTWVAVKLSALVPDASSLGNLSKHILATRRPLPSPMAFPGNPEPSDLDVLFSGTLSPGSPLTQQDIIDLRDLYADLVKICTRAEERGVRVIFDAEHSWYTPAIDGMVLALMRQFNKLPSDGSSSRSAERNLQPLVYQTYQAYLRRTPQYLAQSFKDAKAGNYSLGVKLVRGAYHTQETVAHTSRQSQNSPSISPDDLPPVWSTKAETDHCYNSCVEVLIDAIAVDTKKLLHAPSNSWTRSSSSWSLMPFFGGKTVTSEGKTGQANTSSLPPPSLGVLFGSHNWSSCKLILDSLENKGLAMVEGKTANGETLLRLPDEITERLTMAQLYGMADSLTDYIADRTRSSSPVVLKYVPYGALVEVMPYLSRRAVENKSVLGSGGAAEERKRALAEIRKRLFG